MLGRGLVCDTNTSLKYISFHKLHTPRFRIKDYESEEGTAEEMRKNSLSIYASRVSKLKSQVRIYILIHNFSEKKFFLRTFHLSLF